MAGVEVPEAYETLLSTPSLPRYIYIAWGSQRPPEITAEILVFKFVSGAQNTGAVMTVCTWEESADAMQNLGALKEELEDGDAPSSQTRANERIRSS